MARTFEEKGIPVNTCRIEDADPAAIRTDTAIGLAFPVAFQSTSSFLRAFFRKLPRVRGTEIFMVDTMAAFSGAIMGPLKKTRPKKAAAASGPRESGCAAYASVRQTPFTFPKTIHPLHRSQGR